MFGRGFSKSHPFSCPILRSEGWRDLLPCASLTRTLRPTSESMALIIRDMQCSRVVARVSLESWLLHQGIQGCTHIGPTRLHVGCELDAAWMVRADRGRKICLHRTHINAQRFISWFSGFMWFVIWDRVSLGGPRILLKQTGSEASSRGRRLTFLRTTTTSKCSNDELLRAFIEAQEDAV